MGSFSLSGGVEVLGFISPTDSLDTYAVIDPLYGIDGFRNVNSISDLNNIPEPRRRAGMVVGVSGGTQYYKLLQSPWTYTISDWGIFNTGGSNSGTTQSFTGGTVTGSTVFTNGLSATTISATTYLGLPTDIYVTGGTYSNGVATFTNVTGGTFDVNGFYTGETSYVNSLTSGTGLSANTTTGNITIINTDPDQVVVLNNGSNINVTGTYPNFTIDVTGLTDNNTYVTGFTYQDNTFTISDNSGSTFNTIINTVTGLTVNGVLSATTYQNLPLDVYVTGLTFNVSNYDLTINRNDGVSFTDSLSILASDLTVTGGTYDPNSGVATFTNNTGGTFNVSGFITGFTDIYTTGITYSNNEITISDTSNNTYSTFIDNFTGLTINGVLSATTIGTSGDCVDDIYVSNIHSCSPLNINPLDEGNVYFGSTSGVTFDLLNNKVGIGTSTPSTIFQVVGNYTGGTDALIPQMLFQNSNTIPNTNKTAIIRTTVGTGYVAGGYPEIWLESQETSTGVGLTKLRTVSNHPLLFYTNDLERVRLTETGNFGINTPSPSGKLHVRTGVNKNIIFTSGSTGNQIRSLVDGNASYTGLDLDTLDLNIKTNGVDRMIINSSGDTGIGITSPAAKLHINNTTSGNTFLAEDDTNPDSTPFVIDLSGNTGIGTLTPTVKLQVSGKTVINSTLSGSSFERALSITNTSQEIFYVRGFGDALLANSLYLGVQNGNNSIGPGNLRIQSGVGVGLPFVQFNHNNGTTAFRILSNTNLELQPSAGNVLIGTTNDLGYKLNVNGSTNIGGDLVVSGITGTTWFSGNSSSDLVRVTQTGSGNAFVVEDNTNPDSSPFVIDASGNTGIGTLTPQAKLDVSGTTRITGSITSNTITEYFNTLQGTQNISSGLTPFSVTTHTLFAPTISSQATNARPYALSIVPSFSGTINSKHAVYISNTNTSPTSPGFNTSLVIRSNGTSEYGQYIDVSGSSTVGSYIDQAQTGQIITRTPSGGIGLSINRNSTLEVAYTPINTFQQLSGTPSPSIFEYRNISSGNTTEINGLDLLNSSTAKFSSTLGNNAGINLRLGITNALGVSNRYAKIAAIAPNQTTLPDVIDLGLYVSNTGGTTTNAIYIKGSDQNVGIGVTSPTAKLHINNTTSGNTFLAEDSTNPDSSPFLIDSSGNVGIGTLTPTAKLQVRVNDFNAANGGFVVTDSGNTESYFTVSNVGQVGIRTPYTGSNNQFLITNTNPSFSNAQVRFNVSGDYAFSMLDNQGYGFISNPSAININTRSTQGNINLWTQAGDTTRLNLGGQDINPTIARTRTIIKPVNSNLVAFTPSAGTAIDYSFENGGTAVFQPTGGTASYTQIQLRPTYNTTGSYSGTVRGLYYNPILTSLSGTTHRAIETTTGDVLFGTTSGNVGIGLTGTTAKLHINNTTSGNTFLAEDDTNPDSTPFVIDASGNTGIGTLTPSAKLDIFASSALTNTIRIRETGNAFNNLTIDNSGTTTIRTNGGGGATQFSVVHNGGTENFRVRENSIINFRSAHAFDNSTQMGIGVGRNLTNGLIIDTLNIYDTPNTNRNLVGFTPGFAWAGGNNTGSTLNIAPTYNIIGGSTTALVRGIYYNPILTSLSGTTHRSIETTTGDVIFGSTSGNVGIGLTGTTSPTAKLHINNTTSGNTFLAEDDTNPDFSPFVIDASGNTGIGTLTPQYKLDVSGSSRVLTSMRVGADGNTFGLFTDNSIGFSRLSNGGVSARLEAPTSLNADRQTARVNGREGVQLAYDSFGRFQVYQFTSTIGLAGNFDTSLTNDTSTILRLEGTKTPLSAVARGANFVPTLSATSNNDTLIGLDINPTFQNSSFTGVTNLGLRVNSGVSSFGGNIALNNNTLHLGSNLGNTVLRIIETSNLQLFNSVGTLYLNAGNSVVFGSNNSNSGRWATFFNNGNLVIQSGGTHTDAGFKLDVIGNTRVSGDTIISSGLSASTVTITTQPTSGYTSTEILMRNSTTGQVEITDSTSPSIYNYGMSYAMTTFNYLT